MGKSSPRRVQKSQPWSVIVLRLEVMESVGFACQANQREADDFFTLLKIPVPVYYPINLYQRWLNALKKAFHKSKQLSTIYLISGKVKIHAQISNTFITEMLVSGRNISTI
jgi:cobalamin biosynthesis Co2+ chelatase CbiK